MGLLNALRPKWKHGDADVRLAAAREIRDPEILCKMIIGDGEWFVRHNALVALRDLDPDQKWYGKLVRESRDEGDPAQGRQGDDGPERPAVGREELTSTATSATPPSTGWMKSGAACGAKPQRAREASPRQFHGGFALHPELKPSRGSYAGIGSALELSIPHADPPDRRAAPVADRRRPCRACFPARGRRIARCQSRSLVDRAARRDEAIGRDEGQALLERSGASPGGAAAKRLLLVGAGPRKGFGPAMLRRVAATAVRALKPKGVRSLAFGAVSGIDARTAAQALIEGVEMGGFEAGCLQDGSPRRGIDRGACAGVAGRSSTRRRSRRGCRARAATRPRAGE